MPNLVFMGTPDFAKISLERIIDAGYEVSAVVTNTDKQKGRGMKFIPSPVKEYALEKKIKVLQPQKLKENNEFYNEIKNLNPDLIVVVAYGKILPKQILDIPKLGCINLHGSLLPKYRGAAPVQWAVLNGDKITGVTTMYMDETMDTGDMILKQEVKIDDNETMGELWNRLADIGADKLVETIKLIYENKAPRIKQTGEASIAPMLDKQMSKIDWNKLNANQIKNLVRGLNPIMGAYCFWRGKKVKLWKVDVIKGIEGINLNEKEIDSKPYGTIVFVDKKRGLYIKCIDGFLSVLEIQAENSKKMSISNFLNGNKIELFETFM